MSATLQTRVLALVGASVFIAGGALSMLSRASLRSLEREVTFDQERLAASLAREVARTVGQDVRLLSGAAAGGREALQDVRRYGGLTAAALVVDTQGAIVACEPAFECRTLQPDAIGEVTRGAMRSQRPVVSNALPQSDGRMRLVAVLPFRIVDGPGVGAAALTIDPADRRLAELLDVTVVAPTLRARLSDGSGQLLAGSSVPQRAPTMAAVAGTPWVLELTDQGADPMAPIAAFRSRSLWLAPGLAVIATLLGWGIVRSVRRPIVELTADSERIAGGDLGQAIDTAEAARAGGEIGRLATALEHMRQALQSSIREIEESKDILEQRVARRTRDLAEANTRLEEREQVRQRLLRQVISAQEDERKRIARELHDETSQTLAALGIGVDVAMAGCRGPEAADARRRLEEVRTLVGRMHAELHRLIVNLRPSVLDDLGLGAAVRWFAERQGAMAGLAVRCELADLDERLPPEIETAVFRAVQEAIVNVTRHAAAESVLIQGSVTGGRLVIEIEDDGVGFTPAAIERHPDSLRGIGLLGMRERIELLGGTMVVDSTPGSGTRVMFEVPVSGTATAPL